MNTRWNYTVFVNPGSHITLDDYGRIWHIIYSYELYVYNSSGIRIASWNISWRTDSIYDIILLPNYILLETQVKGKNSSI